jgi:methylenetetrahydrofolate reductase (NADPH)
VRICVEQIVRIRSIEGVAGIHLMAPKNEHLIAEIVSESGLLSGRAQAVQH